MPSALDRSPDLPFDSAQRLGRLRIAVVSPFLDKSHGTERCVVEQLERLARDYDCDVAIYSQKVSGTPMYATSRDSSGGSISWRKVPDIPGPHLLRFIWWFAANHAVRWWDRLAGRFTPDIVYSPGINCVDADAISVHIVFGEFYARVREQLILGRNPVRSWPRLIHRRIYYRLIMFLEGLMYRSGRNHLAGVSKKVACDLNRIYEREKNVGVIYHGVDSRQFNRHVAISLRSRARRALGLDDASFVLLLVGNDWKKKGLAALLLAMARLRDSSLCALIVGRDDPAPYHALLNSNDLRVLFLPVRDDVEWYYAAADVYVGPSLEDAFALPPIEAMACGVPAIISREAGVSELITNGIDGLVLEDPADFQGLADCIHKLVSDPALYNTLSKNAIETAGKYTWEKNTEELFRLFVEIQNS